MGAELDHETGRCAGWRSCVRRSVHAGCAASSGVYPVQLHQGASPRRSQHKGVLKQQDGCARQGRLCQLHDKVNRHRDLEEPSNDFHFPKSQVPSIVATAGKYFCPKKGLGLSPNKKVATATTQPPLPTTTQPTQPPLTQQQQSAVEEANQYLSTQAFSQQGLIDQLDSSAGSGYSVNDATVAVDSLNENWNNEAVQAAKEYLKTQPFSCTDLINQLDSSAGDQYTVAQATYGATQAGDCAGGVPSGNSGNTGNS